MLHEQNKTHRVSKNQNYCNIYETNLFSVGDRNNNDTTTIITFTGQETGINRTRPIITTDETTSMKQLGYNYYFLLLLLLVPTIIIPIIFRLKHRKRNTGNNPVAIYDFNTFHSDDSNYSEDILFEGTTTITTVV
jgi:hypothetical protein